MLQGVNARRHHSSDNGGRLNIGVFVNDKEDVENVDTRAELICLGG